ncbi:MAG: hypothetical protein RSJ41_12385, partial [Clostridia bacterium]
GNTYIIGNTITRKRDGGNGKKPTEKHFEKKIKKVLTKAKSCGKIIKLSKRNGTAKRTLKIKQY